jgi:hypothetical protein
VLEWGPSSLSKTPTALVQSTSGNNFDGALVGSSLVMFMRNWPAAFASITYPASGATTHYISDLAPNTTYNVSGAGAPSTATTDTAGVLVFAATGAGEIVVQSMAKAQPAAKDGTTARSGAGYAAGAVAAAVVLASYVGRVRSRTARTGATHPQSNRPKIGRRESLTVKRGLLDT